VNKKSLFLLVGIIIIASFLRLYQITITPPGLYPDEAMNGNNALMALRTHDWKVFYPENNGREGLFVNVQSFFLRAIGKNEPWVLRLPSAIFGILTVLGIYFLAAELFSVEVGLLSAFFLATSFWHVNFSRIGFRAIAAPFFLTWTLYFLLRAMRSSKSTFYFLFSIFSGVLFGLGFYTYIAYRVMPLLILVIIIYFWKKSGAEGSRNRFLITGFCFLAVTFLVALPIGIYFLKNPADFLGRTSQISIFNSSTPLRNLSWNTIKTLGMFNFQGDWNWRHNLAGAPELYWPVGILFLLGLYLGLKTSWQYFRFRAAIKFSEQKENIAFLVLFGWFVLAFLPVVISNEGIPHALRSLLLITPAMIFAAVGGVWLHEKIASKIRGSLLFTIYYLLFAVITLQAYTNYFLVWAKNPNVQGAFSADYVRIGRELNSLPNETPKYVIVEAQGVIVRDIPMPAQTVMFITDTLSPESQKKKNIRYVLPEDEKTVPIGAPTFYIK